MLKFFLGVVVTLAVLYPDSTKRLFNDAVDTTSSVVKETLDK